VTGTTDNFPSPALNDPTTYVITTAAAPTLSVDVPTTATENGGTISATVSRNINTVGDVVVNLTSSNTAVGTVPVTVTIPSGQASVSFVITLINDSAFDGSQPLTITAMASGFVGGRDETVVADDEVGNVVISEIMYNPNGGSTQEQRNEWVEIVNEGTTTVDLSGWRLNDREVQDWGRIASGSLLLPGEVAVIYNRFFGLNTDTLIRTDWKIPAAAKVFGVNWSSKDDGANRQRGGLFNSPTVGGVILALQDTANNNVDVVDFGRDGTVWPASPEGASIFLIDPASDNNVGTNWRASVAGQNGAVNPTGSVFSAVDRGSPGYVRNTAPTLTRALATVSGSIRSTLTNNGTWADPDAGDVVTLTASLGDVVRNADGTWSWSLTPVQALSNQSVTITATDVQGASAQVTFTVTAIESVILNSYVMHGGGSFTGDGRIDTGKSLAKEGPAAQTLTFDNLINTTRGINLVAFEVKDLAGTVTAADFDFRMSPTGAFNEAANPPATWPAAPTPTSIVVTPSGANSRVTITWPDNAIANRWLRISVLANANTGLASAQAFYLGHLFGETTGTLTNGSFVVQVADVLRIRPAVGSPVGVTSVLDINKNGVVQINDITAFRSQVGVLVLRAITIPASSGTGGGGGGGGGSGGEGEFSEEPSQRPGKLAGQFPLSRLSAKGLDETGSIASSEGLNRERPLVVASNSTPLLSTMETASSNTGSRSVRSAQSANSDQEKSRSVETKEVDRVFSNFFEGLESIL
jgi:hypothetical protein